MEGGSHILRTITVDIFLTASTSIAQAESKNLLVAKQCILAILMLQPITGSLWHYEDLRLGKETTHQDMDYYRPALAAVGEYLDDLVRTRNLFTFQKKERTK